MEAKHNFMCSNCFEVGPTVVLRHVTSLVIPIFFVYSIRWKCVPKSINKSNRKGKKLLVRTFFSLCFFFTLFNKMKSTQNIFFYIFQSDKQDKNLNHIF